MQQCVMCSRAVKKWRRAGVCDLTWCLLMAEKGQLGIAIEVMQEVGLADILLVGIAKGEERRPGFGNDDLF